MFCNTNGTISMEREINATNLFKTKINNKDPLSLPEVEYVYIPIESKQKKKIEKAKFVVNGAGAAAMACIKLSVSLNT